MTSICVVPSHSGVFSRLRPLLLCVLFWLGTLGSIVAASAPSITSITFLPSRGIQLQLAVQPGESYTFEISTNLTHWEAVGGIQEVTTNLVTVVDEDITSRSSSRFYRMRVGRFQRMQLAFNHFAQGGTFEGPSLTPTLSFPVTFSGFRLRFDVEGDSPYPPATQVFFAGPSGSTVELVGASVSDSEFRDSLAEYWTSNIDTTTGAMAGTWTVNYRGTNTAYSLGYDPLSRLVIPVPAVQVQAGMLKTISWVYRDRIGGNTLSAPPAYMRNVQLQIEGQNGRLYDSPENESPSTTTHPLTETVAWANVQGLNLAYDDVDGNHFVIFFWRR